MANNEEIYKGVCSVYDSFQFTYWLTSIEEMDDVIAFCKEHDIGAVTVAGGIISDIHQLDAIKRNNIRMFIYTIDDIERASSYIKSDIGIYTNFIKADMLMEYN